MKQQPSLCLLRHVAVTPGWGVTCSRTRDLILMPDSFITIRGPAGAEPIQSRTLMHVTRSRPSPSIAILTVTGEIDYTTAGELREHLRYGIATSARLVVVDLSRLTFLGLSGLRALLDADDHARRHCRALCVVVGPRCVNRLFEVCGPTGLFTVDTIAEACRANPWVVASGKRLYTSS
ncbi:STAS domain-containing protein [Nocardia sp. NPDC059764]|uniref:STAS domain-containing protein n=1 Tax=Nocardia sp. NPDC059764 TaxID=3346939 RepID=UPI00365EDB0B